MDKHTPLFSPTRRDLLSFPVAAAAVSAKSSHAQSKIASKAGPSNVHLILDAQAVERSEYVEFHLHEATKHAENPVIIPGMPHEWDGLQINWPSQVLYDREDKLFRCWYSGVEAVQYDPRVYPERRGFAHWFGRIWMVGYAESRDGVYWEKPSLDQYKHRGMPTNVIKTDYEQKGSGLGWDHLGPLQSVWINPARQSPDEKYLSMNTEIGSDAEGNRSFKVFRKVVYSSPDGKRWKRGKVFYDAPSTSDTIPAPNVLDINQVIYEPDHPEPALRVKAYGQTDRPIRKGRGNRGIGVVNGPDLFGFRYEDMKILMEADTTIEDEIHWSKVTKLENGHYLMIHDSSHLDPSGEAAPTADQRLAISSDGIHFRRIHPHNAMIRRGTKAMFDANMLVAGSIVEFGDHVHFYYHGAPVIWRPWPRVPKGTPSNIRGSTMYPTFMGLATVPRDRFGFAAAAAGKTASLTSLPFELYAGKSIWVNVEGGPNEIVVTLISKDERMVTQGRIGPEHRMTVYQSIHWNNSVPAGEYCLRVELRDKARLYSFAIL